MFTHRAVFLLIIIYISLLNIAHATSNQSILTMWRTYDLKGQARSILKFYEKNGEVHAYIAKILLKKGDVCNHCKGTLKNKPYLGMTIIRGLQLKNNKWINGKVLDTDSGNIYSCQIRLSEDGHTMHLHAYKGIPLFGRTINWQREA